jgi:hypothetical protein
MELEGTEPRTMRLKNAGPGHFGLQQPFVIIPIRRRSTLLGQCDLELFALSRLGGRIVFILGTGVPDPGGVV